MTIATVRTFYPETILSKVEYLNKISIEELNDITLPENSLNSKLVITTRSVLPNGSITDRPVMDGSINLPGCYILRLFL